MNYSELFYRLEIYCPVGETWVDHNGTEIHAITLDKKYRPQYQPGCYSVKSFGELYRALSSVPDEPVQSLTDWNVTLNQIYSSADGSFSTMDLFYFLEAKNEEMGLEFDLIGCKALLYLSDGSIDGPVERIFEGAVVEVSSGDGDITVRISERIGAPKIEAGDFPVFFGNYGNEAAYWPVEIKDNGGLSEIVLSETPLNRFDGLYIRSEKTGEYFKANFTGAEVSVDKTKIYFYRKEWMGFLHDAPRQLSSYAYRNFSEALNGDSVEMKKLIAGVTSVKPVIVSEILDLWSKQEAAANGLLQLGRHHDIEKRVDLNSGYSLYDAANIDKYFVEIEVESTPISLLESGYKGIPECYAPQVRNNFKFPRDPSYPRVSGNPDFFIETSKTGRLVDDKAWYPKVFYPLANKESFCFASFTIKFPEIDLPASAVVTGIKCNLWYEFSGRCVTDLASTGSRPFGDDQIRIGDSHAFPMEGSRNAALDNFDLNFFARHYFPQRPFANRYRDFGSGWYSITAYEPGLSFSASNVMHIDLFNRCPYRFAEGELDGFMELKNTEPTGLLGALTIWAALLAQYGQHAVDWVDFVLKHYSEAVLSEPFPEQYFYLYGLRLWRKVKIPFVDLKLYAKGVPSSVSLTQNGQYVIPAIRSLLTAAKQGGYNVEADGQLNTPEVNSMLGSNETAEFRDKLKTLALASSVCVKFYPEQDSKILVSSLEEQNMDIVNISMQCVLEENNTYSFAMETPMKDQIYSGLQISWGKDCVTGEYRHKILVNELGVWHDETLCAPVTSFKWSELIDQLAKNSNNGIQSLKTLENEWVKDIKGAESMAYNCLRWCCAPLRRAEIKLVRFLMPAGIDIGKFVSLSLDGYPEKLARTAWLVTGITDDLDSHVTTVKMQEAWNIKASAPTKYILQEDRSYINTEDLEGRLRMED